MVFSAKLGRQLILVVLAGLSGFTHGSPSCTGEQADTTACLRQELGEADAALNAAWKARQASAHPALKSQLLSNQQAWIKERNTRCQLPTGTDSRAGWLDRLVTSDRMSICVLRETRLRTTELGQMGKTAGAPRYSSLSDFLKIAPLSRSAGKWFFEVSLDRGAIARWQNEVGGKWPTRFWVGCAAPKIDYDIGVKITVLPDDTGGVETVGFAIDLDQGVAHFQQNGNWLRGGSSRNDPHKIRSGAAYVCAVEAVLNIQTLIDRKLATVNFGESPFRYAPLAGFLPLHTGFQWVQGGETADRRVYFDYRQLQENPATATIFTKEEFATPRDSGEGLAPNTARIAQLDLDCTTEQFTERALTLLAKDGNRVAMLFEDRGLDHRPGMDTVGGRFARTLCFLRKHRITLPSIDVQDSWEEMQSPVSNLRIFEAKGRRQLIDGMLVAKLMNETDAPVNIHGRPSRALVAVSAYDCKDLTSTPLVRVRYDEQRVPLGIDFFGEQGVMRLEKNRQRMANACAGK